MTKYRIVKYYYGVTPMYRLQKQGDALFARNVWIKVFESTSFERCEEYLNDLREVQPPTVIKEYEF